MSENEERYNLTAGPTLEAYADPSVVDRCFELLKDHKYYNPDLIKHNNYDYSYRVSSYGTETLNCGNSYDLMKKESIQVRAPRLVKGGHRTKASP